MKFFQVISSSIDGGWAQVDMLNCNEYHRSKEPTLWGLSTAQLAFASMEEYNWFHSEKSLA